MFPDLGEDALADQDAVSKKSSDTSSANTMALSPKSHVSSVTRASETTVYMFCCTSSHQRAMG
jgi:hypothetical protein